jgi:LytR cell envelope-related transcriptional attenuator
VATKSLTVDSGLSLGDMRKLASRFSHLDPAHVTFLTAPIANANYRATSSVYGNQPQDNVELDPVGMAALFAGFETDTTGSTAASSQPASSQPASSQPASPLPSPTAVQVSVENGTSRTGLAHTAAAELQTLGFQVSAIGNVTADSSVTTITYSASDLASAESLQAHVPGATLVAATTPGIVLTLGANFTDIGPAPVSLPATPAPAPNLTCAP